jgi:RNA polymerase sigma-70 factor (ECF subfamily)
MAPGLTVTDTQLLQASRSDPRAFGAFYARHERRILAYLVRRTRSPELAADLTAEVFALALGAVRAGAATVEHPAAWLLGIANHKLIDAIRRSQVDDRARRELGMRALTLTRQELSAIERLEDEDEFASLLAELPPDQQQAVRARVLDDRSYAELAGDLRCSESVVRKRVSRGLAALRARATEARG